jgi:hypothetical protein
MAVYTIICALLKEICQEVNEETMPLDFGGLMDGWK